MLVMPSRPSTSSSFSPSLASLSFSTLTVMSPHHELSIDQAPPPTCNQLDSAQRTRLIKSTRKLEKVLGTTPFVLEELPTSAPTAFMSGRPQSRKGRDTSGEAAESMSTFVKPTPILTSFSAVDLTSPSTSSPLKLSKPLESTTALTSAVDASTSQSHQLDAPAPKVLRTRSLSRASIATFSSLQSFVTAVSTSTGASTEIEHHDPSSSNPRRTSFDSGLARRDSTRPLVGTSSAFTSSIANAFVSPFTKAVSHFAVTIPGSDRHDSPHPPLLWLPKVKMGYGSRKGQKIEMEANGCAASEFGENASDSTPAEEPEVDRDALSCALSGVTSPGRNRLNGDNGDDDTDLEFARPARSLDDIDVDRFPSRAKSRLGQYTYSTSDYDGANSDGEEVIAEFDELVNPFSPPPTKTTYFDLRPAPRTSYSYDESDRRARARKLEKLTRHLGEKVPSELVFGPRPGTSGSLKSGPGRIKRSGTNRTVSSVASFSPSMISSLNEDDVPAPLSTSSTTSPTSRSPTIQPRRSSVSIGISGPSPSHALGLYGSTTGSISGKKHGALKIKTMAGASKSATASPTVVSKDVDEWDAAEYQDVVKRLRALKA